MNVKLFWIIIATSIISFTLSAIFGELLLIWVFFQSIGWSGVVITGIMLFKRDRQQKTLEEKK